MNSLKSIVSILLYCLLVACYAGELSNEPAQVSSQLPPAGTLSFEMESILLTQEELLTQADLIFAGVVIDISPTRWNQDSGEYWRETTVTGESADGVSLTTTHSAWPVYEIRMSVTQSLVDEVGVDNEVVLMLLGKSPGDGLSDNGEIDVQIDAESVNVHVGQELVVFASQEKLDWRDSEQPVRVTTDADGNTRFDLGTRTIITLKGLYANAYLVKGDDGLYHPAEEATNVQPPISLDSLIAAIPQR